MNKIKKYFKWSIVTVVILFVIGLVMGSFGDDRRPPHRALVAQGLQGDSWVIQQHHVQHGSFHFIGFMLSIVLWGIVIVAVLAFIRKRVAKRGYSPIISDPHFIERWSQPSSTNAVFLDQWEKNLNQSKEK